MKSSKVFVVAITVLLVTWIIFGLIGSFVSGDSIRECMSSPYMFLPMLILAPIPATIICVDYRDHLDGE